MTPQKRSLSQVFLHDSNIINKIIEASHIQPNEAIVEIGCGTGILTQALIKKTQKLIIFEIDAQCIAHTQSLVSSPSAQFIHGDILSLGFEPVSDMHFRIIANIPYHISTKVLKLMINSRHRLGKCILMVQKEFSNKLMANPHTKDYTSLTLYCRYYFNIRSLFRVSKNCFYPIPKVDSRVIELAPRSSPPFKVNEDLFFTLIRSAFWGRRKTLLNCLAKGPYIQLDPRQLRSLSFFKNSPRIRGESLSLDGFYTLYKELMDRGII